MKAALIAIGAAASLALAGCATVQPWEKGNLAKPAMTFGGDWLETRYADHVYTSREAASGGAGVGGGGCGCN
jgi:hypothetical protein